MYGLDKSGQHLQKMADSSVDRDTAKACEEIKKATKSALNMHEDEKENYG